MKTVRVLVMFAVTAGTTAAFATGASAKILACPVLKQSIDSKLQAHAVKRYTLELADMGTQAPGKQVGSCDGGTRKIFYVNFAKLDAMQASELVPKAPHDRHANEAGKLRHVDTAKLIDSLRKRRNHDLYYSWPAMPPNVKELARRPDDVAALVTACDQDTHDELFRFNVRLILNHKLSVNSDLENDRRPDPEQGQEFHSLKRDEKKAIADCLLRSLQDKSAMVRTEAVWGLGFIHDPAHESAVMPLLQDSDAYVAKEAATTLERIRAHVQTQTRPQ